MEPRLYDRIYNRMNNRIIGETLEPISEADTYIFSSRRFVRRSPADSHDVRDASSSLTAANLTDPGEEHDTFGYAADARGCAQYIMHPKTGPTVMAIYGSWGQGKSHFMRLMEQHLLMTAVATETDLESAIRISRESQLTNTQIMAQHDTGMLQHPTVVQPQLTTQQPLVQHHIGMLQHPSKYTWRQLQEAKAALRCAAHTKLVCSWFNAWQYTNDEQIWAGLVVAVVQAVEAVMPRPQRWLLAWRYNLCTKGAEVFTHLILPVFLTVVLVLGLAVFGIVQLQSCLTPCPKTQCISNYFTQNGFLANKTCSCTGGTASTAVTANSTATAMMAAKSTVAGATMVNSTTIGGTPSCQQPAATWLSVLVAVTGVLLTLLVTWTRVHAVIKPLSVSLTEKSQYMRLPDHSMRTGYQHEVIKDLKILKLLIQQRWYACGCMVALCALGMQGLVSCVQCLCCCCFNCSWHLLPCQTDPSRMASASSGAEETKLILFIDDLDRVQDPDKVVDILAAVNLVLTASGVTAVIGMDKQIILGALEGRCKDNAVLKGMAHQYLEKIVHVSRSLAEFRTDQAVSLFPRALLGWELPFDWPKEVWLQLQEQRWEQRLRGRLRQRQQWHQIPMCVQPLRQLKLPSAESDGFYVLAASGLAGSLTPRQIKRFSDHFHLKKFLLYELLHRKQTNRLSDRGSLVPTAPNAGDMHCGFDYYQLLHGPQAKFTHCQLLGWEFFWTLYPKGMEAAWKYYEVLFDFETVCQGAAAMPALNNPALEAAAATEAAAAAVGAAAETAAAVESTAAERPVAAEAVAAGEGAAVMPDPNNPAPGVSTGLVGVGTSFMGQFLPRAGPHRGRLASAAAAAEAATAGEGIAADSEGSVAAVTTAATSPSVATAPLSEITAAEAAAAREGAAADSEGSVAAVTTAATGPSVATAPLAEITAAEAAAAREGAAAEGPVAATAAEAAMAADTRVIGMWYRPADRASMKQVSCTAVAAVDTLHEEQVLCNCPVSPTGPQVRAVLEYLIEDLGLKQLVEAAIAAANTTPTIASTGQLTRAPAGRSNAIVAPLNAPNNSSQAGSCAQSSSGITSDSNTETLPQLSWLPVGVEDRQCAKDQLLKIQEWLSRPNWNIKTCTQVQPECMRLFFYLEIDYGSDRVTAGKKDATSGEQPEDKIAKQIAAGVKAAFEALGKQEVAINIVRPARL